MTCRIVLTGVHSPPLHLPLVKVSLEDAAAGRGGELALAMHGAVLKVALVRLARRQLELPEAMVLALTVPLANIRLGSLNQPCPCPCFSQHWTPLRRLFYLPG